MKTLIYLIRHAQPITIELKNVNNNDDCQIQNEKQVLSLKGEKQALELSKKDIFKNIDSVYSSKYVRAIETAKYIASENNIPILIDERLGERKVGVEEKSKEFWLEQMYNENIKAIGGENQKEVRKRMIESIEDILKNEKGKKVAVVTHATAMTFLLMNWCKLENAMLDGKKRKLSFNNKIVIDDSFNTPEVFELVFDDDVIYSIKRINLNKNS